MSTCLDGHASAATDYCDVCGIRMDTPVCAGEAGSPALSSPTSAPPVMPCPQCGAPGVGQFCEACGFTTEAHRAMRTVAPEETSVSRGDAPHTVTWTAVITASRAHYEAVVATGGLSADEVTFPVNYPERRIPLTGSQLRIGRRSVSREVRPEIDLTEPPTDPAISRLHAVLVAQPDGSWALIDPGSENGTSVNGAEVDVGDLVPLHDGDSICIGAWTAIAIEVS